MRPFGIRNRLSRSRAKTDGTACSPGHTSLAQPIAFGPLSVYWARSLGNQKEPKKMKIEKKEREGRGGETPLRKKGEGKRENAGDRKRGNVS